MTITTNAQIEKIPHGVLEMVIIYRILLYTGGWKTRFNCTYYCPKSVPSTVTRRSWLAILNHGYMGLIYIGYLVSEVLSCQCLPYESGWSTYYFPKSVPSTPSGRHYCVLFHLKYTLWKLHLCMHGWLNHCQSTGACSWTSHIATVKPVWNGQCFQEKWSFKTGGLSTQVVCMQFNDRKKFLQMRKWSFHIGWYFQRGLTVSAIWVGVEYSLLPQKCAINTKCKALLCIISSKIYITKAASVYAWLIESLSEHWCM